MNFSRVSGIDACAILVFPTASVATTATSIVDEPGAAARVSTGSAKDPSALRVAPATVTRVRSSTVTRSVTGTPRRTALAGTDAGSTVMRGARSSTSTVAGSAAAWPRSSRSSTENGTAPSTPAGAKLSRTSAASVPSGKACAAATAMSPESTRAVAVPWLRSTWMRTRMMSARAKVRAPNASTVPRGSP